MEITDLFKGIAIVIDDEIGNEKWGIDNLIKQIKARNMPCYTYDALPETDTIHHFEGVSFILLDWKLLPKELTEDTQKAVRIPDSYEDQNIAFLKELKRVIFAPVFIFTNENEHAIIRKLEDNNLYEEGKPNFIFVKKKGDLKGRTKLFKEIEKWAMKEPPIYVLKVWDRQYQIAKNSLFWDLYVLNPSWPQILWKAYEKDGVDMSQELGGIVTKNLHTRMTPFFFDKKILKKRGLGFSADETRKVLEGERFIKDDQLKEDDISTGDVFKKQQKYYLNIRAQCDLVVRDSAPDLDDVELYCLKGKTSTKNNTKIYFDKGQFNEKISHAFVPFIHGGKIIEFRFENIEILQWKDLKDNRIGRLLPPYITRIQQRYALYLQRQGLPRIPKEAIEK